MRKAFCQSLVGAAGRPGFVFLTGDLGFMALGAFIAIWPRSPFALDRALGLFR